MRNFRFGAKSHAHKKRELFRETCSLASALLLLTIRYLTRSCGNNLLHVHRCVLQQRYALTLSLDCTQVYFMPQMHELKAVNEVLSAETRRPLYAASVDVEAVKQILDRGIENENLQVRLRALQKLQGILGGNRDTFVTLATRTDTDESTTSIIPLLIQKLIGCLPSADAATQRVVGACLGYVVIKRMTTYLRVFRDHISMMCFA